LLLWLLIDFLRGLLGRVRLNGRALMNIRTHFRFNLIESLLDCPILVHSRRTRRARRYMWWSR